MKHIGLDSFEDDIDSEYEDIPRKFGLTSCLGCLVCCFQLFSYFKLSRIMNTQYLTKRQYAQLYPDFSFRDI